MRPEADIAASGRPGEAAELLDTVFETAPIGLVLFDTEFCFLRINRRLAEINGAPVADHLGRRIEDVLPGNTAGVLRTMRPTLMAGRSVEEVEFDTPDPVTGEPRWWVISYTPLRNPEGQVDRFLGTVREVTARKQAEQRSEVLVREIDHRIKNLLSLVQSIARQTHAGGAEDFLPRFEARLEALAGAQDVLMEDRWTSVDFERLARSQLAHLGEALDSRLTLAGPQLAISAEAAQHLAMAVHELGTNAVKHGALSSGSGEVRLSWSADAPSDRLELTWCERGGPDCRPPARRGFGTLVLGPLLKQALDAYAVSDFRPEGLVWRMTARLGDVIAAR
ncbi:MAG: HWE histidine kinase domain-containing protein [Oceanicaulis sp.]